MTETVSGQSGQGSRKTRNGAPQVRRTGLKIGRSPPADIVLSDPRVSRSHCRVELAGEDLKVTDLKSTNGTFIDGERVEGEAMLAVGSLLRVGNVCFKHEVRSGAEA